MYKKNICFIIKFFIVWLRCVVQNVKKIFNLIYVTNLKNVMPQKILLHISDSYHYISEPM